MKTIHRSWILRLRLSAVALCSAVAFGGLLRASPPVTIEYDLAADVYTYSVINNMAAPLGDIVVYFPDVSDLTGDVLNYTLLGSTNPAGWSSTLLQPSAINLGGLVEWSGGSIAPGGAKSGFGVSFSYSGSATLGSQYFEIYDANWDLVDSGFTTKHQHQGVPDSASTLGLLALSGLALVGWTFAAQRRLCRS